MNILSSYYLRASALTLLILDTVKNQIDSLKFCSVFHPQKTQHWHTKHNAELSIGMCLCQS